MAIIRRSLAALTLAFVVLAPIAAPASNPCTTTPALRQINAQIHQLDQQRRLVHRQYPGPGNAGARRNALLALDAQRDSLENQKRTLKAQQRDCKEDRKHRKHGDHDRD